MALRLPHFNVDGVNVSVAIVDETQEYTAREAAPLLEVTAETVKQYCREGFLKGKQVGRKKQWKIKGAEIIRVRGELGLNP